MKQHILSPKLEALITSGATLTLISFLGGVTPLADAFLSEDQLWYCALWPESEFDAHWVDVAKVTEDQGMLNGYDAAGELMFTIAPMEDDEREESQWEIWHENAGKEDRAFVAQQKEQAMNATF